MQKRIQTFGPNHLLWVDIVGSVSMYENMNPEEYAEVLRNFYSIIKKITYEYDGDILSCSGDGIAVCQKNGNCSSMIDMFFDYKNTMKNKCNVNIHGGMNFDYFHLTLAKNILNFNNFPILFGNIHDSYRLSTLCSMHSCSLIISESSYLEIYDKKQKEKFKKIDSNIHIKSSKYRVFYGI